jgi:hypothetical protein
VLAIIGSISLPMADAGLGSDYLTQALIADDFTVKVSMTLYDTGLADGALLDGD